MRSRTSSRGSAAERIRFQNRGDECFKAPLHVDGDDHGRARCGARRSRPTPIAVPLLGTQGAAGPYGSSIQINARGGASHVGQVGVSLLGVTHPCPEDLAVLLVHAADKHLLMSNAGGCRPLQGTNLFFHADGPVIPNTEPVTPVVWRRSSTPSLRTTAPPVSRRRAGRAYTPGMPGGVDERQRYLGRCMCSTRPARTAA